MVFTTKTVKALLQNSESRRSKLVEIYGMIPSTLCKRRTRCCSLLPEMTLIEALQAIERVSSMSSDLRKQIVKKMVGYFFLNPVEIVYCPFLENQDCIIYHDRFFGCRAYGLWSREYYDTISTSSCHAKEYIQKQWERLGVLLPEEITKFRVPYCPNVRTVNNTLVDDAMLLDTHDRIETLSRHFTEWHQSFKQKYFYDLSFLLTSLIFGFMETIQMKFHIVKDITTDGNRTRFSKVLEKVPDIFEELI